MNKNIIDEIANNLNINAWQVEIVLKLLSEGNTVPFIARYRKEATGALDEELIRKIEETYLYQENLLKRKEDVIRLIDEKGLLTPELKEEILKASKLVEVEDLYRPFKEKKKTKATEAIKAGLEPLAKRCMNLEEFNFEEESKTYINDMVKTIEEVRTGVMYIIAEYISDNATFRKWIRAFIFNNANIISKKKKNAVDEKDLYKNYYDFASKIKGIKSYRVLAINRGETEKILTVTFDYPEEKILEYLENKVIKKHVSYESLFIDAIKDSMDRLIIPSVEREIRSEMTDRASSDAIKSFASNLEALLMTPPLKEKVILALDPAYRTGCKLAVLDKNGNPEEIAVIYPTPPMNKILESKRIVLDLINKYHVDVVAIGNGTASRESEAFIADTLKEVSFPISYVMVNEAGASVYSASPLGIEEFPDLTVEKRSAISIGRRLQDSLSELVKIDPKSIGVGLYQHDVKEKELSDTLDFTVTKAVNKVGVNVNTASPSLLKYVSGLNKRSIEGIINYRLEKHGITNRNELKKINGVTDKVYEQSVGFLRIINGDNPLDKTSIHPDNYQDAEKILNKLSLSHDDIGKDVMIEKLNNVNLEEIREEVGLDKYTFDDIIEDFRKPNRDPRDDAPPVVLKSDVLTIDDLNIGMELTGTVRNVVPSGLFIDIGLHNDGLAHISKLSKNYVKDPSDLFQVGDIVTCYVHDIDKKNEKVSLSLLKEDKNG
ncbi:MAG: RNA-binding transcriptional accessory protein [Bacilli bacterium]|nr:RNA-binding transcriptional accessory protein [Bacilli bacterium]